jgi:tRNA pseudouridine65 synthase
MSFTLGALVNAPAVPLDVLYRDEALVVVNKPSGLAVHRGYSSEHGDYLLTRVRDAVGQLVYLAHRLDRATSGAIALTLDAQWVLPLQRAFEAQCVSKRYLALVRGRFPQEVDVDYAIPRSDARDAPRVPAQTQFRCIAQLDRFSLVEATPRTGRYHQIRRHLKHLRHPIAGDTTYGDGKQNRYVRERFGLTRLFLHASALTFPHPRTGVEVTVEAPLPEVLAHTLRELGYDVQQKSAAP